MRSEGTRYIAEDAAQEIQEERFAFDIDSLPETRSSALKHHRESSWRIYQSIPFPRKTEEAWRRTNLSELRLGSYRLEGMSSAGIKFPESFSRSVAGDVQDGQVIIQPGKVSSVLKKEYCEAGVLFGSLREILETHPRIADRMGSIVKPDDGKFAAVSSAMSDQGVILYVPKDIRIINPLHSLFWTQGDKKAVFTRLFVWLEDGAVATFVHEYASSESEDILHCGLVEIHAGEGSHLKFVELQSWGKGVWNFAHERADVQKDASVEWILGAVGSKTTKCFSDFDLNGEGASIRVSGFSFADGKQHLDYDTQQNHHQARTTSDLLYKGAITGEAYSIWQGMIRVDPKAQKADGYQANRNLLLSKSARADSIPGLEIKADDVRCTHGSTVGKIDFEQEFYLCSRGLSKETAQRLIVEGFFEPVMDRIPFEGVKDRLRNVIQEKMDNVPRDKSYE